MRRWMLIMGVAASFVALSGCKTVTMSEEENQARYDRNLALMERQLGDDIDYFLLARSQSRLSRWHTR